MTVAFLVDRFLIAALCCVDVAFVVNLYWKISLHMTAGRRPAGYDDRDELHGTGAVSDCAHRPDRSDGALGSARLQLGSHSLAQVGAGAAAGIAVTAATVLLI